MTNSTEDMSLVNIFPDLITDDLLIDFFSETQITGISFIKKTGILLVEAVSGKLIPAMHVDNLKSILTSAFSMNVDLNLSFDLEKYVEQRENEIIEEQRREMAQKQIQDSGNGCSKGERKTKSGRSALILGKKIDENPSPMSGITLESGEVTVSGDVSGFAFREISGGRVCCSFDITDYTNSITVKFFARKDYLDRYTEKLADEIRCMVRGEIRYDKFEKDITLFANDIMEIDKSVRRDEAEVKRVELHAHTQMSVMDAVIPAAKLVERAAQWGHKAIAITDHGVVQAYPEIYQEGKRRNIKIIYGVECYLLDNAPPIVYRNPGFNDRYPLDGEFVVFDIETTGLNPVKDKITEIGAVKILKGEICGSFSTFVNPGISIPEFITKLTGINDSMVQDAPSPEDALEKFLSFTGDLPLVAHNASFDAGFIRHIAEKKGIGLKNTIIDTLQMSRRLFPRCGKYRLDTVAKYLNIKMDGHHRAVNDAETAAGIFLECCKRLTGIGVSFIHEIDGALQENFDYKRADSYHAIILVKNQKGLKNLYRLITASHMDYFYKRPRVPKNLLLKYREGLIIGSACESGELYSGIVKGKSSEEIEKIAMFYDYLEIQPLDNNGFLIANGKVSDRDQLEEINKKIVELGDKLNKPVIASCDVHFLNPEDEVFRRILMAGQGYADADKQAPLYFKTTEEMLEEFACLGDEKAYEVVITNTNLIADMTEEVVPIPEGTFPPSLDGTDQELKEMAYRNACRIYGDKLPDIVKERLDKELTAIIKNGFSVMYAVALKLVEKSNADGYIVGSRGSVGSSLVATMTGITEVNPLPPHYLCESCNYSEFIADGTIGSGFDLPAKKCPNCNRPLKGDGHDIPFETFLGFDGNKAPDIDLNFSGEYQAAAQKYMEVLFGRDHVFKAGTISTIAEKTAYGFVKKYMDENSSEVTNAEINRLVAGCKGVKKTTGQHPGGIIVIPKGREIEDFTPIQRPADDMKTDIITTHFDFSSLQNTLLKLDILGHDDPTMIKLLEDLTGIDVKDVPVSDEKVMDLFLSTDSLGVKAEDIKCEIGTYALPEFGTKFVRQMLLETKPRTFSDLLQVSGLSHGTDVWTNNARDLVRNGTCTISEVIGTRDNIMVYLMYKGMQSITAFKISEDVRKGKGLKTDYEEDMKNHQVPDWYIASCKKIKYMFPKAHAAAYVLMAMRIGWFKVYYPLAFYVAYFTVRADEFDAVEMTRGKEEIRKRIEEIEKLENSASVKEKNVLTILEVILEMYCRGLSFLPVDLYKSDAVKFMAEDGKIRPPLFSLPGLGVTAAGAIAEARSRGRFVSVEELRSKARLNKTVIEVLEENRCLEGIPQSSQISFF